MPACGIIVYVNGEESGLWSIQEFRDRCKSLQEIIDSGIAVTSKEYDPFVIAAEAQDEDDDDGQTTSGFFFDNTMDLA